MTAIPVSRDSVNSQLIVYMLTSYLYFVSIWWSRTSISSFASSLPGQACIPLPNGKYVFGFGGFCKKEKK
ncbi:hypothetical protein HanRHA438_Chr10g0460361 [Helianthus annuus]|nr:hypothetical protein HanRHA438_Chr10g0460361 [Helianthus annuus]